MAKKDYWPLKVVARGHQYKMLIKSMDKEGNFIEKKNSDGSPIYQRNIDGGFDKVYETEYIPFHPFGKRENNTHHCILVMNEPGRNASGLEKDKIDKSSIKRDEYIIEEIKLRLKSGVFVTKQQYDENKDPTLKEVNNLRDKLDRSEEEKSELAKQVSEQSKKLAVFESKK
jgi:hypothetical protein